MQDSSEREASSKLTYIQQGQKNHIRKLYLAIEASRFMWTDVFRIIRNITYLNCLLFSCQFVLNSALESISLAEKNRCIIQKISTYYFIVIQIGLMKDIMLLSINKLFNHREARRTAKLIVAVVYFFVFILLYFIPTILLEYSTDLSRNSIVLFLGIYAFSGIMLYHFLIKEIISIFIQKTLYTRIKIEFTQKAVENICNVVYSVALVLICAAIFLYIGWLILFQIIKAYCVY
ncbi:hypothetical protein NEPAR06_1445 [Nematocida parisii]|uniref:Uncharacterized protein n=1 Tax=Nematocida parisii (strain ERTm3) TaxID=935791 RepID=I3EEG9_NEMP3|nr:uncharacterized protein NEPG_02243 [Nematocida parisii ERTm1]EIJ87616.1 hypothetical protein NEQG_02163 [Nematocida parisii ERTm3]KAI5142039.1 hypothetical protein NEPAR04_1395 [Nematocida parisii]EIJ92844.1 hypothetical protein NEPG_02243 [Nematocida parisii ERTm1]KAI5145082.1 hypothetical protein NEPAR07_1451 [Nematocida parisii]KAI5154987.1 hypothetical protein NEPAR06_1445 [Nematocida parisii]|eukprot:XP_013060070.1 hypothetical protein NEPG_02243 [Nematocida parisii ERTm1]